MPKLIGIFFRIFFNLIPIVLMSIGKFEAQAKIIIKFLHISEDQLDIFMFISFIIGVGLIYLYYPFRFQLVRYRQKKENNTIRKVARQFRKDFCIALGKELNYHNLNLNVRHYLPVPFHNKPIKEWLKFKKKYFQVYNFDELCDCDIDESFSFEVEPIPRGMVGKVYESKDFMYDDKLSSKMDYYNLDSFHKSINSIRSAEFSIAKSILTKNNNVKSIITFETQEQIMIPNDQSKKENIEKIIGHYTNYFSKIIPHLKK